MTVSSESKIDPHELLPPAAPPRSKPADDSEMSSEAALASASAKINMYAPLVWQTLKLTKQEYLVWVHEPFLYTGAQKEARLFEADWLEPLTKTKWYVIPAIWLPVAAAFWSWWVASPAFSWNGSAAIGVGGVCLWTLLEYSIHRGVFHLDDWIPDHPVVFLLHFLLHGIHHKIPMDHDRLVMPPVLFATLATAVYSFITPLALTVLPWAVFHALFGTVVASYVCYDMIHYSQHHVRFTPGTYMHAMKQYHMKHHFSGMQHLGFGITSKVWDHVLGTVLDIEAAKAAGRSGGVGVGGGKGGGLEAIAKQD